MTIAVNRARWRHRIEVQEASTAPGAHGDLETTWTTIEWVWGSIREDADDKFTVEMEYFEGLIPTAKHVKDEDGASRPQNRLKHETRILNIHDVLDVMGQRRVHRVLCVRDKETF